jgi:D-alanine-D-alanine ligase
MNPMNDRTDLPVLMLYNIDYTWMPQEIEESVAESNRLQSAMQALGHPVTSIPISNADLATPLGNYDPNDYIVFNWCEGVPGIPHSDALVAQTLESMRFAYTGSTPGVLRLSQDKRQVKRLLDTHGVPTPQWRIYETAQPNGWNRFPAIVKPAEEHCSFGVTPEAVVMTHAELYDRIAYIIDTFHQPALVEDFIDGREFHVSLWGNGAIQMLPPAEMDFSAFSDVHDRLCTYSSKFDPTSIHYNQIQLRLPAPLSEDEYRRLEQTSIAAYHTCGCRDYARLDIRLRDGVFYVLDVNPNADISSEGSMACAAEIAGYSFGAMGSHIVNLAALRHPILGNCP